MAPSIMDEFLDLIGGEENLPEQLSSSSTAPDAKATTGTADDPDKVYANLEHVLKYHAGGLANIPSGNSVKGSSFPQAQTKASPTNANATFELDPRYGEPAPLGISFCPWSPVARFCYKFVDREWQQTLASAFFDANKIWDREWDLYYVHSDQSPTLKPVILVPESQFQVLLDEINKEFPQVNISITHVLRQRGFAIDFDDLRTEHRPRYLGCSISRTQHEYWAEIAPVLTQTPDNMGEDRSLKAFKAKMALIAEISCKKNNGKKASAHHDRVVERMEMTNQTLRAQRYLGLLPRKDGSLEESMAKMTIGAIDPSLPSPFPFDQEPIIISFDVEAWEMSPNPITEVGIATLDTRDLKGIAPGRVGTDWQKLIRARHFRILEHAQHKNGRFVDGCPEHFEFGASEFVSKDSIAQVLATCFKHPFSKPPSSSTPPDDDDDLTEERNIVLLGHDITQDINYLAQLGFNVTARKHLLEAMDTLAMHRAYTHDPNGRALGAILGDFDLLGWHLHNAGNDAVYTLWAMLAIAVQHAAERHNTDRERALTEALQVKSDAAAVEARDRVSKNAQGWHPSDGAEDGGVAVPPDEFKTKHEKAKKTLGPRGPAPTGRWTSGGNVLDV